MSPRGLLRGPGLGDRADPNAVARRVSGFTLIEVLIAMAILALAVTAIYSSWTAILRASKVGLDAAAAAQRARVSVRVIEQALHGAQMFAANGGYYAFVAENGSEASLSFVARLPKAFPRSGKFGDLDLRRVSFSLEPDPESGQQLVLRQNPILMELDVDEKNHPVVLARHVRELVWEFWDARAGDWVDEWATTNQLPRLVKISLRLDSGKTRKNEEEIVRIVGIPTQGVAANWQVPSLPPTPGMRTNIPPPTQPGMPTRPGMPVRPGTPVPPIMPLPPRR